MWAKRLREHPYMGARIPMKTLHSTIHAKVHDIPRPKELICQATIFEIDERIKSGELDPKNDSLEKRLTVLIDFWSQINGMEATVAMIKWQRQIVQKFYQSS